MQSGRRKTIPVESLLGLKRQLDALAPRAAERKELVAKTAHLFGVSSASVYRALRGLHKPKSSNRDDRGKSRKLPMGQMEKYCQLVAALKLRTTNKQGRHVSTRRCIEIIEEHGVESPQGLVKVPAGMLNRATVDRYLRLWHMDQPYLRQPLPAARFQAEYSNDCWQFDITSSDLKHIECPSWVDPGRGQPKLMLFSVVDDRSGVCYQEYRCGYGEDAESGLRFLFHAMNAKPAEGFRFMGIPKMIYLDNGPIAKSSVFLKVMEHLGIAVKTHIPASKEKRHCTGRAKGKVERPFRTIKEAHETLYHFHQPKTEEEANQWLHRYLLNYNSQPHRNEPHSRIDDWLGNLPKERIREMCSWERFCAFAREPERRKVGIDARISVNGTIYEVDPALSGEEVILWWGLFDTELYIEYEGKRFGPYSPVAGPIPLHRYRAFRKTKREERFQQLEKLAAQIGLPKSALTGEVNVIPLPTDEHKVIALQPFRETTEDVFSNITAAKLAIAEAIGKPLAKISQEDRDIIDALLQKTLDRKQVLQEVRGYFRKVNRKGEEHHAG